MRSAIAVLTLLLGAPTASSQDVAIQRMNNIGGVPITSGGGHAFAPAAGYIQPTIVNNYLIAAGDSRTANSMIFPAWSSGTFTTATNYSNGYAGWLFPLSGNRYLAEIGWNYAVGAQTTAGIAGRLWNTTQYCNDSGAISAACFTDASSTVSSAVSANPSSPLTIPLEPFPERQLPAITLHLRSASISAARSLAITARRRASLFRQTASPVRLPPAQPLRSRIPRTPRRSRTTRPSSHLEPLARPSPMLTPTRSTAARITGIVRIRHGPCPGPVPDGRNKQRKQSRHQHHR